MSCGGGGGSLAFLGLVANGISGAEIRRARKGTETVAEVNYLLRRQHSLRIKNLRPLPCKCGGKRGHNVADIVAHDMHV